VANFVTLNLHAVPSSTRMMAVSSSLSGTEAVVAAARSAASATGGLVILTFIHWEQADELANYLAHIRDAGLLEALVAIALDEASVVLINEHGISAQKLTMPHQSPYELQSDIGRGARAYEAAARLQATQLQYVASVVHAGIRVWLSDVRTLWKHSPKTMGADEGAALSEACEVAFAVVAPQVLEVADGGGQIWFEATSMAPGDKRSPNVGLSMFDGGERTAEWLSRLQLNLYDSNAPRTGDEHDAGAQNGPWPRWLQSELSRCRNSRRDRTGASSNVMKGDGCPDWCMLPPARFPNIHAILQQPDALRSGGVAPVAFTSAPMSRERFEYQMREAGLWLPALVPGRAGRAAGPGYQGEKFLAYKELLINNGLSNTRNALRSALAVATLTNRTLILPPFWSRHLVGKPYKVGVDYYFDVERLFRAFPRVRESTYLQRAFPDAVAWPPKPSRPLFFVQLQDGESMCAEISDTMRMEALGNVAATCPPLRLQPGQLRSMKASRYHLGATSDELVRWLAPHANEPLLFFGRMFRRFHRFSVNADDATFRRRYAEGVQPAPEIRAVASRALRTLRSAVGGDGNFDCVHMRRRDFVADHASEEISVEEYARRAAEKLRAVKKAQPPAKHKRNDKRHGERKHHGESTNSESEEMFDVAIYLASDVAELPETKAAFGRYFRAGAQPPRSQRLPLTAICAYLERC